MIYNEIDPFAAQWLENLMVADQLPWGSVDRRDIRELKGEDSYIVHCSNQKDRRVGRNVQPLANGIPRSLGQSVPELRSVAKDARGNRIGRLRGYGNAIVPEVAAMFVRAFMEVIE